MYIFSCIPTLALHRIFRTEFLEGFSSINPWGPRLAKPYRPTIDLLVRYKMHHEGLRVLSREFRIGIRPVNHPPSHG